MSSPGALLNAVEVLKKAGIKPGHHVADFGVGHSGHFALAASRHVGDTGKVYAVEILEDVLRAFEKLCAMHGHSNIHALHGDFEAQTVPLVIDDGSVDLVTSIHNASCIGSFEHLAAEAHRILSPDGKLFIVDWKPEVFHPIAPSAQLLTSILDAQRELMNTKFTRADEVRIGRHHWGLILSK